MLITMICLKLSQGYSRICMYVISTRIFLSRGRGNHSKRFYDTKEIPRDSLRHFPFRFCVFSFRFLLQHLTLTLRLTWRARKPKSLILWFRWPVLLLLGRYKCYTCSRGGRWVVTLFQKGFNSQLPRRKFGTSKPESVSTVTPDYLYGFLWAGFLNGLTLWKFHKQSFRGVIKFMMGSRKCKWKYIYSKYRSWNISSLYIVNRVEAKNDLQTRKRG